MIYPISEIFNSIQGEGHFVGYPMTFVRLAGCSVLGCHIRKECDEAPWKATERLSEEDIFKRCRRFIVNITGGEPTDHDLVPLVSRLRDGGHRVHVETSGARHLDGIPFDWITVSPKLPGYEQRQGHTLKIVVRPEWSWKDVLELDRGTQFFHRYLQPLYGPNNKPINLPQVTAMIDSVSNMDGRWALSVQAHKFWEVH